MAIKFFGQFLVEGRIISNDALQKALALQQATNLKFGEQAMREGFITEDDIERVHQAQRREDMQFGDMCVKLGIITLDRLKEVLAKQKKNHLYIGEALVKLGALKAADLPKNLAAFHADQAPYLFSKAAIPASVPHAAIWDLVADMTYKMLLRVANMTVKQGQCALVRGLEPNDAVACVRMSGSLKALYLLSVSSSVRNSLARAILKTEDLSRENKDMLNDTIMEFANIVCGHIAAKAAQLGKAIEIAPPELVSAQSGIPVPMDGMGLLFPFHAAEGRLETGFFMEKAQKTDAADSA